MRGRPGSLRQSTRGEANRILLAFALSSMRIICPYSISRRNWIIAVSLGWFVSLRTSSIVPDKLVPYTMLHYDSCNYTSNWNFVHEYCLFRDVTIVTSSICRHHWSSASILRASVFDITQQSIKTAEQYGDWYTLAVDGWAVTFG